MKAIIFGATGMVGQGVLRELLLDEEVSEVLAIVRSAGPSEHSKLRELVHRDFSDFSGIADRLEGYDACFFCLGVSSAGMSEDAYTRVTYDITMAAAKTLAERSPKMRFLYVSGAGTQSSERGSMWARVKGKTENALLAMPFAGAFMFRPAFIQPMHGIVTKTKLYRAFYALMSPFYPLWRAVAPNYVTTTEEVGRAMLEVAKHGADARVLENKEINAIAARTRA